MRSGDRVAAAVSGGPDSIALLWLLLELRSELGIVLSVTHVNHKLRGAESDEDERFVRELAGQHGLEMHACEAPIDSRRISTNRSTPAGIEAAGRELRYSFFRQLAREGRVAKIATAHTLDDQAETVMLRLFRGTGIRGLSGIHPRITFADRGQEYGEVLRPLLSFRRAALREFLLESGLGWREDASNLDVAFLRNRVRHRLLPMITAEFGEAAIEHLSELAEIARAEEEHWTTGHPELLVKGQNAAKAPQSAASLPIGLLLELPLAAQRRMALAWLEANAPDSNISFRLIEEILERARSPERGQLECAGGWNLRAIRQGRGQELILERNQSTAQKSDISDVGDYEYALAVPGAVDVVELGACIEARIVDLDRVSEDDRGQLLDPALLPKEILIRNWRPGDRYWPAHTAATKKVKELLSDRHVTGSDKRLWPVGVAEGHGLVWMRGFAVPAAFRAPPTASQAIWIREIAGMM
jgi:tRNA(Ile)-lysidine synthase